MKKEPLSKEKIFESARGGGIKNSSVEENSSSGKLCSRQSEKNIWSIQRALFHNYNSEDQVQGIPDLSQKKIDNEKIRFERMHILNVYLFSHEAAILV